MIKRLIYLVLIILLISLMPSGAASAQKETVYIIPVQGMIDGGMAAFIKRAYNEAEDQGAARILLEIDTPGGRIDSAVAISQNIINSPIPSAAFVTGGAISAGVLLTLSAPDVIMSPGSTIGAAEPRLGGEKADEKTLSYWTKQLEQTAELHGRDGRIAAAMSDADIEIPGIIAQGKLLTLTSKEAADLGIADTVLATRDEVIDYLDMTNANIIETRPSLAEKIVSLVTNPYITPILLTIGFYGLLMEIYTAGWGVPGTMGIIALSLFFGGHLIAGFAGIEAILLFVGGVILLALEIFLLPGFGVAGIGGIAALIASIVVASVSFQQALISLIVVLFGTIILFLLTFKFVKRTKFWQNLILGDKLEAEKGYSSADTSLVEYLGREGITITPLRPAGTLEFADGERLDVVTEGSFIAGQVAVKIIKVEGTRVIVREINK